MKTRSVVIHRLSIRSDPADGPVKNVTLTAYVSKGTYIRSLARDIALALGTVGHVAMLRRTRAGPFTLDQAISLDKLGECGKGRTLEDIILPLEAGQEDITALCLTPGQARLIRQGQVLVGISAKAGLHCARLESIPVALDRRRGVSGKRVSVRVELGGSRVRKKINTTTIYKIQT